MHLCFSPTAPVDFSPPAKQLFENGTSKYSFSLLPKHVLLAQTLWFLHSITVAELRVFGGWHCFVRLTVSKQTTNIP